MTIEEMRADDGPDPLADRRAAAQPAPKLKPADRWDNALIHAPAAEERRGAASQEHLSEFVKAVMSEGGGGHDDFGLPQVEQLLSKTARSGSAGGDFDGEAEDPVLPIYFAPSGAREDPLRAQAHKAKAVLATRKAFVSYVEERNKEKERIYRENKSVEAAQRRQAVEHLKQRMERQKALLHMKSVHQEQIKERLVPRSLCLPLRLILTSSTRSFAAVSCWQGEILRKGSSLGDCWRRGTACNQSIHRGAKT
jgi:hypothetical protein